MLKRNENNCDNFAQREKLNCRIKIMNAILIWNKTIGKPFTI